MLQIPAALGLPLWCQVRLPVLLYRKVPVHKLQVLLFLKAVQLVPLLARVLVLVPTLSPVRQIHHQVVQVLHTQIPHQVVHNQIYHQLQLVRYQISHQVVHYQISHQVVHYQISHQVVHNQVLQQQVQALLE